jgi:putative FmdB family regulatory protein
MPLYDYRCPQCGSQFESRHGFSDSAPACPVCGFADVQRVITTAPSVAKGILAHPGDGHRASKEQLESKWAEETPKLRRKLVDKLGEETVNRYAPTLNTTPGTSE